MKTQTTEQLENNAVKMANQQNSNGEIDHNKIVTPLDIVADYAEQNDKQRKEYIENWIKSERTTITKIIPQHPLHYLSLSDLISLHGWIDYEADLIEASTGDITAKLEKAREQMMLVQQEIEKRRSMIFGG